MTFSTVSKTTLMIFSVGWLLLLPIGSAAEPRASTQNARLSGRGPRALDRVGSSFKFVVIGDTHTTGNPIFRKNIAEINEIDPDLVVGAGDLIDGSNDARIIRSMWSDFERIVQPLRAPFIMLPGNHDIHSRLSDQIYRELYGKTYKSFDYMNAHFITLSTQTLDQKGEPIERIDDEQLQWLKADLASHKEVTFKFVFLHKPLWDAGPGGHWMTVVHPLLARYGVTAVFSGHLHKYTKYPQIDGVQYYITGGGGGTLDPGGFFHYCLVTVRPRDWSLAVIKTGSVMPDNAIVTTPEQNFRLMNNPAPLDPPTAKVPFPVRTTLKNLFGQPVEIAVNPAPNNNPHWKLVPVRTQVRLNKDQEGEIRFEATVDDIKNIYPLPTLMAEIKGKSRKLQAQLFTIPAKPLVTAVCPRVTEAPKIDGKLDDPTWTGLGVLSEFVSPSADRLTEFPTNVKVAYDSKSLYLAIRCHEPKLSGLVTKATTRDGAVWEDDSVEVLVNTAEGRPTYHFVFNANAVIWDGIGNGATPNGDQVVASGRETNAWTLEVAIPWKTLGMADPQSGRKMGLDFVRNRIQQPTELSQWSPTFGENDRPSQFGTLSLK